MSEKHRFSAPKALTAYGIVSFVSIVVYRFIVPGAGVPLPPSSFAWRLTAALIDYTTIFPAVAFSAIVASFAFDSTRNNEGERFSSRFLEAMTGPLIAAIVAASVYAVLYLLVYPSSFDARSTMASEERLFHSSVRRIGEEIADGHWREAARHMATCERIWPNSPETEALRDELRIGLDSLRNTANRTTLEPQRNEKISTSTLPEGPSLPGVRRPVNASEALSLAKEALNSGRPYDAHWFATLAGRIARVGSPEIAAAPLLASEAWNAISSLEPSEKDRGEYATYKKKREGYRAIIGDNWIRSYYIFKELSQTSPSDPDVQKFLAMSEEGARSVAFFADEVGAAVGSVEANALFSLPAGNGRDVLRFEGLHIFSNTSFAEGVELLHFDAAGQFQYKVEAKYGKLLPFFLDAAEYGQESPTTRSKTLMLLLALDREDEKTRWAPRWQWETNKGKEETSVMLEVSYEDLLLASRASHGVQDISAGDLNSAPERLQKLGFVPQAFNAELIRRFSEPFAFLSLAIMALAFGWRLRAPRGAGGLGIPMLVLLPFVIHLFVQAERFAISTLSTAFVILLPFGAAIGVALAFQAALLIVALAFLAGQRG